MLFSTTQYQRRVVPTEQSFSLFNQALLRQLLVLYIAQDIIYTRENIGEKEYYKKIFNLNFIPLSFTKKKDNEKDYYRPDNRPPAHYRQVLCANIYYTAK